MKKILLALSLFVCLMTSAQPKIISRKLNGQNAVVYLPSGYDSTKAYPVLYYFVGLGEEGVDPSKLLVNGPFTYLKAGVDLKLNLIAVSIQCVNSSPRPSEVSDDIIALQAAYKVNAITATGISRGGQSWDWFFSNTSTNVSKIAAVVMVSSEGPVNDEPGILGTWLPTPFKTYKVPYWFVCGDQDADYPGMTTRCNSIRALDTTLAWFTTFKGAGHSTAVWIPSYAAGGIKNPKGQDIYQYAASFGSVVTAPPPVVVPPVPVTPTCPPIVPCPSCPPMPPPCPAPAPPCPVCPKQRSVISETANFSNGVFTVTYQYDDGSSQTITLP